LRERGRRADTLEQRAEQAEREREQKAREAVLEERARIARELHDVVAHSVSVMVMQTGVVRRRLHSVRPDDAALLDEVEQTGRGALGEMRRLLGLLRADEDGLSLTPQPGVDRIGSLVEQMREAGLPVDLRVEGEPVALPAGLDLAAYRVVQEGLTNALKHAGRARAAVLLRYRPWELELEIADDGRGPAATDGLGHGLVGMRERVALYGGTLVTGARPEGGFLVRAVLPLEGAA
jgi:signal transduction histidine kinase